MKVVEEKPRLSEKKTYAGIRRNVRGSMSSPPPPPPDVRELRIPRIGEDSEKKPRGKDFDSDPLEPYRWRRLKK